MNNYPTINYIGSKQKIVEWIVNEMPLKSGKVLDLFCGGCSVAYRLKEKGFEVTTNDYLYSNFALAKAIIANKSTKLSLDDFKNVKLNVNAIQSKYKFLKPIFENKVYYPKEVMELSKLSLISDKLEGFKKYLFLSLLRRAMIRKIPYSRMNVKWEEIKKFRNEEYSYKKYGRYRSYHNKTFSYHIECCLKEYNNAVFDNKKRNKSYNCDAINLISSKNIKDFDIIYLDPPYPNTMNNYLSFYGKYDDMFGIKKEKLNDFTNSKTFMSIFSNLLKQCCKKTKYIVISLNNKCDPSADKIIKILNPICSEITKKNKQYSYRVTNKENKKTNYEILIIAKIK